jgi:AraC-like DNA-binding protein
MSSSFVLTTTDIDEFRAAVRPVNKDLTITGRGQFSASVTRIDAQHLWMQRSRENLPRAWELAIPPTRTAVLFGAELASSMGWRGAEIAPNEVIPARAGISGWHTLPGAANWGSLSLPNDRLAEASIALLGRDVTPSYDAVALVVPPPVLNRLRRLHEAAGQLAESAPEIIDNPDAARGLEQCLTEAMLACLDTTGVRRDTTARHRHAAIIRRFRALTDARTDQALYLPEICKALSVNERTLHLCCQEQFGVSPKRYLFLRRLQLARRALRTAVPATGSVTEVATRYGFWELGRFAVYYKHAFGESPSTTLSTCWPNDFRHHLAEIA